MTVPPKRRGSWRAGRISRAACASALSVAVVATAPVFSAASDVTWGQTAGGPIGGTVTRMQFVGSDVWASLYSGGIYKLTDGRWQQVAIGRGIPENRTMDFVVDPTNAQKVYAAQIIACGARTTNGAASWDALCPQMLSAANADNVTTQTLALDPADPSTIYYPGHTHTGESVLLVSTDGGDAFTQRYAFPGQYDFNSLVFFGSRMFLGTREGGMLVSDDRGTTWSALNDGLTGMTTIRLFTFAGRLYLIGGRYQFNVRQGGPLYRLNDAGTAWQTVNGVSNVTGYGIDGGTLWLGTQDNVLYRTTNGTSFTTVRPTGLAPGWVGEMAISGSTMYVGLAGAGIYRSTNGGSSFAEFNSGMLAIATREVHVDPANAAHIFVIEWDRPGMYVSTNSGSTYRRVGANYNILTIAPDPRSFNHIYAAGDQFFEGTFSGTSISFTRRVKPGPSASVIKSLAVHPTNNAIVLAGVALETAETPPGYGLWRSIDHAKTWKRASGVPSKAVYSIVFNKSSPSIVYATALGAGIYKSTNSGASFVRIGPSALKYPYRLAIDPRNPKHLVAGSNLFFGGIPAGNYGLASNGGGVWETKNSGSTWTDLTTGMKNYPSPDDPNPFEVWRYNFGHLPNYEEIVIDPKDSRHIIVGHHGESVVSTTDGGATWLKQSAGMIPGAMHNYGYCLRASANGSTMYACSCGRGLFRGSVASSTGHIAWEPTQPLGPVSAGDGGFAPKNAREARAFILSGAYDHPH